jgi:hypothetical protein
MHATLKKFVLVALALTVSPGAGAEQPFAFASAKPGDVLPSAWEVLTLPNMKPPEFRLVDDAGATVLRSESRAAVGSIMHKVRNDLSAEPILEWRWKIAGTVRNADLARKSGDDFAARVYVSFDYPFEALSLGTRTRMLIAKVIFGRELPSAVICYVWDNKHPVGHVATSAYTDRVRLVVLQSGDAKAGQWQTESRDLAADFRLVFGGEWKGPVPPVTGIAVGNDTDQTGENATAWFGDFKFRGRS